MYMKTFGRANGSSAVSAVAYRAGERIRDERSGRIYDHSAREGVLHKEIVLPAKFADSDMGWAKDRAMLWNAAEASEARKNARVAREFLVALPAEMTAAQRLGLAQGFAHELADRYGFAVDVALHAPRTDPRNHHAHLLATTRELGIDGFGAKTTLEITDAARHAHGLEPFFREVIALRERWAAATNQALAAAHIPLRVDHRSLEAQGIDREPEPVLPRAVWEIERRGERSVVGERIRAEHQARVAARQAQAEEKLQAQMQAQVDAQAPREPVRSPVGPPALEEVRRRAREAWLEMRRGSAAMPSAGQAERTRDDDLGR